MSQKKKSQITLLVLLFVSVIFIVGVMRIENKLISVSLFMVLFIITTISNIRQKRNYKNFAEGKSLLDKGKYEECTKLFNKFILDMEKKTSLKKTTLFSFGLYTKSYEAMTYNNLGSANLNLGNLDEAQLYLDKAVSIDNDYGIPYVNLALLARLNNDYTKMKDYAKKAKELGVSLNLE